jgi:type IV pilus biogenesis protein PilP
MKTALKIIREAGLTFLMALFFVAILEGASSTVWAQTATPTAAPPPSASAAVPDATPKIVLSPADIPDASVAAVMPGTDKEEKNGKSLGSSEDKVSDSVKGIAKRLSSTDNVTLDDLNSAKQAVTKIEALIDLEKHLNELDKLRSEREGSSRLPMPGAMPMSALSPPPSAQMPQMPMPTMPASIMQNPMPSFSSLDVTRIIGSDGRFSAVVKTADGQTKTVQVGDHLEGATITAITAGGVELDRNNSKHVIPVKNIQTVFGSTP